MSGHQGTVAGLLAVIVIIRVVEGGRLGNAWAAVFGSPGTALAVAGPSAPATATGPLPNGYIGPPLPGQSRQGVYVGPPPPFAGPAYPGPITTPWASPNTPGSGGI